jgi:hypothetical protein
MAWTSSGDFLTMTAKEEIIAKIESDCSLSDESCIALKQLRLPQLRKLWEEISKALDVAFENGKDEERAKPNKPGLPPKGQLPKGK